MMGILDTDLCGLRLKNPTILASGIMGSAGSSLKRVALEGGAGALVTKSIGCQPRSGHKNPSAIFGGGGILNAIGLSNPGYRNFAEEIPTAKEGNVPVIGSVFGFSTEEFVEAAVGMEDAGCDALELNLSCPHVKKAGAFYGTNPDLAAQVVRGVKEAVRVPVIPKLTANVSDIVEVARSCQEAGADAITAINTLKAMAIDIDTARPILGNKVGGLSGGSIKAVGVRSVYDITEEVSIPVIGCGGIQSAPDAIEYIMAGATAVQIGTAVVTRGLDVFRKVAADMEVFLKDRPVRDIIGAAHDP